MTAPDPTWVEAGARVFREDMPRVDPRAPWEGAIGTYGGWTAEETAAAVIAAVAPLIRRAVLADLRAKVQAERDKHGPGRAHDRGFPYPCGHCDALEYVLDLIDNGADR